MAENEKNPNERKFNRRDIVKGLATLPILGVIGYGLHKGQQQYRKLNQNLLEGINVSLPEEVGLVSGEKIRIGIVGFGGRARYLSKALGFLSAEEIDIIKKSARNSKWWKEYYEQFLQQDDLNVEISAICDVFDINALKGIKTAENIHRNGSGGELGKIPKLYNTYKELVSANDVDAVIVATPDHLHVPVAMEAVRNGKHVYCEKPLSWTVEETYHIRDLVKEKGIVFQLGHQGRQTESYQVAESLIKQGALGDINLIEVCTNRNDPNGHG